jgi:prephenate dehydratase
LQALGARGSQAVVAFQGEPGAYSQEAVFEQFGPLARTLPCQSFDEIFAAVEDGRADNALLPVENSQAGSINQAYDLLLDHDLKAIGEVKLRVRHCLMAAPGTTPADIRRVRSHPQALSQCERYLKIRGWEPVPAYDTAGAAAELSAHPEEGTAVIASALAGETYDLEILDRGIEDSAQQDFHRVRDHQHAGRALRCPGRVCQPRHQPHQDRKPPTPEPAVALRILRGSGRALAR